MRFIHHKFNSRYFTVTVSTRSITLWCEHFPNNGCIISCYGQLMLTTSFKCLLLANDSFLNFSDYIYLFTCPVSVFHLISLLLLCWEFEYYTRQVSRMPTNSRGKKRAGRLVINNDVDRRHEQYLLLLGFAEGKMSERYS